LEPPALEPVTHPPGATATGRSLRSEPAGNYGGAMVRQE
jgi:hypothetical protein